MINEIVKVSFRTREGFPKERMRCRVVKIEGDMFYGILENNSVFSDKYRVGQGIYAPMNAIIKIYEENKEK